MNTTKPQEDRVDQTDLQPTDNDSSRENACCTCRSSENHKLETRYCSFDNLPLSMCIDDIMPILGIGRNTAYALVRSGKLRSIRIGRQLRISKNALEDFLRGVE